MSDSKQLLQPDIFTYTSYREYLHDFYRFKKTKSGGYSFRVFAKKAGFKSPNLLKLVIEGQRNITSKSLEKFLAGLELSGDSKDYFIAMVNMHNAKTANEKGFYLRMMQKSTPKNQKTLLKDESFQYLSHWIHPVLDELVTHRDFKDDPQWIADKLVDSSSLFQITSALEFLVNEAFIAKDKDGCYKSNNKLITTPANIKSLAIRRYHRIILQQAIEILDLLSQDERDFRALTLSIPRNKVGDLRDKFKNFREDLLAWYLKLNEDNKREDNIIMQINFQVYPQTK